MKKSNKNHLSQADPYEDIIRLEELDPYETLIQMKYTSQSKKDSRQ